MKAGASLPILPGAQWAPGMSQRHPDPCMQGTSGLSDTVAQQDWWYSQCPVGAVDSGCCCGQPLRSAFCRPGLLVRVLGQPSDGRSYGVRDPAQIIREAISDRASDFVRVCDGNSA
jgi:hypothetical protein